MEVIFRVKYKVVVSRRYYKYCPLKLNGQFCLESSAVNSWLSQLDFVVSKSMVIRNVLVDIAISSHSFVLSQGRVKVSTSLSDEEGLILAIKCDNIVMRIM